MPLPPTFKEIKSQDWNTPEWLVSLVKQALGTIELDPCSNVGSVVGAQTTFALPEHNGLKESWSNFKTVYINPPFNRTYIHEDQQIAIGAKEYQSLTKAKKAKYYSTTIKEWVEKASQAHYNFNTQSIILVPANVDTLVWHNIIFKDIDVKRYNVLTGASACIFRGRLEFMGATGPAPMACSAIYYGSEHDKFKNVFKSYGYIL